jgi:hypothetical protein
MTINILSKNPSAEAIHEIKQELANKNSPLRKEYLLDIDDDVIDELQEQPYLIAILFQLLPITADCFKGDRLHLTILKDLENPTLDKLAVVVNTYLPASTAFVNLQELDDRCFQARIPNDILVHVEFF